MKILSVIGSGLCFVAGIALWDSGHPFIAACMVGMALHILPKGIKKAFRYICAGLFALSAVSFFNDGSYVNMAMAILVAVLALSETSSEDRSDSYGGSYGGGYSYSSGSSSWDCGQERQKAQERQWEQEIQSQWEQQRKREQEQEEEYNRIMQEAERMSRSNYALSSEVASIFDPQIKKLRDEANQLR